MQSLPLEKASNMQFQREREVTSSYIFGQSAGMKINICINELLNNSQTYYNSIVIFICNVF